MVRGGKLSLKGKKISKGSSSKKRAIVSAPVVTEQEMDERKHGGWWLISQSKDVSGTVSIEVGDMKYLRSLDNGEFEVGQSHSLGESPDQEEMLLAMKIAGTKKYSFKTGFGKFVGVTPKGKLIATADAVGQLESWDIDFEDDQTIISCENNGIISVLPDGTVGCSTKAASEETRIRLRSCANRIVDPNASLPKEERGGVKQTEINYVKSFQAGWVAEKRLKLTSTDKSALEKSRMEGTFHETLLDRREKIKSDKHCK